MSTDHSRGASSESNSGKLSTRLSPRLLARVTAAVEDGPYHSQSHLVRAALHQLLPPTDARKERGPSGSAETDSPGIHVVGIRETYPESDCTGRIEVDVTDDRDDGGDPPSHTFVYDVDRSNRTATVRSYEPPAGFTHEQATSLGSIRDSADAALAARNWQLEESPPSDASENHELTETAEV